MAFLRGEVPDPEPLQWFFCTSRVVGRMMESVLRMCKRSSNGGWYHDATTTAVVWLCLACCICREAPLIMFPSARQANRRSVHALLLLDGRCPFFLFFSSSHVVGYAVDRGQFVNRSLSAAAAADALIVFVLPLL